MCLRDLKYLICWLLLLNKLLITFRIGLHKKARIYGSARVRTNLARANLTRANFARGNLTR
jgi:uncharacterized protein YjbI with pentapeptide repeats